MKKKELLKSIMDTESDYMGKHFFQEYFNEIEYVVIQYDENDNYTWAKKIKNSSSMVYPLENGEIKFFKEIMDCKVNLLLDIGFNKNEKHTIIQQVAENK